MIEVKLTGVLYTFREEDGRIVAGDDRVPDRYHALRALEAYGRPVRAESWEWPKSVGDAEFLEIPWMLHAVPQAPDETPVDQSPKIRPAVSIEMFDGTAAQSVAVREVCHGLDGVKVFVGGWGGWDPEGVRALFEHSASYALERWGLT